MSKGADLSNVTNVSIVAPNKSVEGINVNNVCFIVDEKGRALSDATLFQIYKRFEDVVNDFGTDSEVSKMSEKFFSQPLSPISVGGNFIIGYRTQAESATSGNISSRVDIDFNALTGIKDGSFKITVDGIEKEITSLDLSSISTISDLVTIIDTAFTSATVEAVPSANGNRLVITSKSTGNSSIVDFITDATSGTSIKDLIFLSETSNAIQVKGHDGVTAKSHLDALKDISDITNFVAFCYQTKPLDADIEEISSYTSALGQKKMYFELFDDIKLLDTQADNVVTRILAKSENTTRMLFKLDSREFLLAYMSLAMSVDFGGTNTLGTMHLKNLVGILPDELSQTNINACQSLGLDIYIKFSNLSETFISGANSFFDEVYGIIALKNALQVSQFNRLAQSKKISQTEKGVNQLIQSAERVLARFVNNGFIGAGTWNSIIPFGSSEDFLGSISAYGYFIFTEPLATQSQEDRENRKAPLMQIASKLQGAIHSTNIIFTFER